MAISTVTATPAAYRTPFLPATTFNATTQPSTPQPTVLPQQTGRAHHHGGGHRGGNLLTASTAQTATNAANGSLLDTLV